MTIEFDDDGVVKPESTFETRPFLRTRYNYDTDSVSRETALHCTDVTRTQQQFKDETDINVILEKFGVTGLLPQSVKTPLQEDFLEATTFQEVLHVKMQAEEAFMSLPSATRKKFDNDPAAFVEFVSHEENREEAKKLGLLMKEPGVVEPMRVRIVPEEGDKGGTGGA